MPTLRLGAAQLHFHPAFEGGGKQPLREPLGIWEGAGLSGLHAGSEEGDRLLRALRERVEKAYVDAFRPRLLAVVRFARDLDLDLLVLPELSVPLALLPDVAQAAGPKMTVVAGSHTVTHEGARKSGVYEALAFAPKPAIGSAVAPVLRGGKAVAAQPKLAPSKWEPDLVLGKTWQPLPLGDATMGVLICIDFLKRADGDVAPLVAKGLDGCAVVAVPSLTPFASLEHFERGAEELLYGYDRPVVYANRAGEGGTRVFTQEEEAPVPLAAGRAPALPPGVEGVVAVEVRLGEAKQRYKPVAASRPLAAAVLIDAGMWGELRVAEEAVLATQEVGEALDRIEAACAAFEEAAENKDLPEVARERWRYLAGGAEGTTSIEHLRALVRDAWVEGMNRHQGVERGLLEGAARVLREVEKKAPSAQKLTTIRGWMEEQARGRFEGVEAAPELVEAVTEGLVERPTPMRPAPPGEDGSFERWVRDPGPFPIHLKRHGFVEDVEAPHVADSGLERAAGLLALWGTPPAWVAHPEPTTSSRALLFVTSNGLVAPFDMIREIIRLPSSLDDRGSLWSFESAEAPGSKVKSVSRGIRELARHQGHMQGHLRALVHLEPAERDRFVEPLARLRGGHIGPVMTHLDDWLGHLAGEQDSLMHSQRSPSSFCLLVGEFGIGKSTVSVRLAAGLARAALAGDARPVIFVDLRAWSGSVTIHGLVRRALSVTNIAPYRFAVEEGECILILDGFDEMSNRLTPVQLTAALRALLAWRTDRSKILLTCRTHLFIDPADLDRVFAEAIGAPLKTPGLGEIAGATVLELQLFDEERIRAYLACVSKDPDRAWEAMGKVHDLRNLAERPLLLDMIRENLPALTQEEAVSLGDLYESYLRRWAEWPGPDEWLTPDQKIDFAEELAYYIWKGGDEVRDGAVRVDRLSSILLRDRPVDWIRRLDRDEVRLELRAGTFLVWQEGEEGGYYRFAHRSFLEYVLARRAVRRLGTGDRAALDLPRFSPEVIAYCKGRPGWVAARAEAAAILVEPYQPRVSENALLLLAGEQGFGSTAERPWRLEGAKLAQVRLRGARLAGAMLAGADLQGAMLAGADFRGAHLEKAVLDGADLGHADLCDVKMKGAVARGATLDGVRFEGADLRDVGFEGSSAFAEMPVLAGAQLDGACITGAAWRAPAPGAELCGLCEVGEARWRGGDAIRQAGDAKAGARVEPIGHRGDVNGVAFSPDGTRVATACDDRIVRIWEARTGRLLLTLEGHKNPVTSVAWTADGERLCTGSYDATARVWEARTGRLLLTLEGHKDTVTSVAWTADGERLCTGSYDATARVWEARTGRLLLTLEGHKNWVTSVAWTADGERLCTGSYDATARVWEARTGRLLLTLEGHTNGVTSVAWTADGERLCTGSDDATARVWEARTGRLLLTLEGHKNPVTSVAWTADGERLCTGSDDATARVWEARTGRLLLTLEGHKDTVTSVAWTADGERLCTGSRDHTARVWEARTGRLLLTLEGHKNGVTSVAWTADGERLCTGSDDATARVWEARTGRLLLTLEGHKDTVTSVAWTADGERLCTGSHDATARVWEARTGRLLLTLEGHKDTVTSVAWTADGERLCTGSRDHTARVWEAHTGRLLLTLEGHKNGVTSVAWTADGERLCTGSYDATARVWEARTGRLLLTLEGHKNGVSLVAWTADGERLCTGSYDAPARVWEARTGRLLLTLEGHKNGVTSVAWTADGERLCTGSWDHTARVWDARTGRLLLTLEGHTNGVTSVAWTADGERLCTGSYDATARVWDVATAREIAAFLHAPAGGVALSGSHILPTGVFDASAFTVRTGAACAPLALYADLCIRPDLVTDALAGKPVPSIHIPMDIAARAVAAATDAFLCPSETRTLASIRSGTPTTLPAPWTLAPDLTAYSRFRLTLQAILPGGAVLPLEAAATTLRLPALPPGAIQLLLNLHLADRHERSFTFPLTILPHNPYIAGPPVRGADLVGRDADLARIHEKLRRGSIQLAGERRIGKTSLLHHLADHPGAYAPVWLDAQELSEPAAFRTWVAATVRHHLADAPGDPADLLPFLRRLAASGKTPLLLVDEISHLQGLSARDAGWLRSLSSPPVTAVLAGSPFDWSRFFASLPDAAGSPFNHLQPVTIGPLIEPELRRLVARDGVVPPDEEAMHRILDLSGGRPYLAQRLCEAALDRVQREERLTMTRGDVDGSVREALVVGLEHQHRKRWAELDGAPEVQRALVEHVRSGAPPARKLYDALLEHGLYDGLAWTVDPAFAMWVREREAG